MSAVALATPIPATPIPATPIPARSIPVRSIPAMLRRCIRPCAPGALGGLRSLFGAMAAFACDALGWLRERRSAGGRPHFSNSLLISLHLRESGLPCFLRRREDQAVGGRQVEARLNAEHRGNASDHLGGHRR